MSDADKLNNRYILMDETGVSLQEDCGGGPYVIFIFDSLCSGKPLCGGKNKEELKKMVLLANKGLKHMKEMEES